MSSAGLGYCPKGATDAFHAQICQLCCSAQKCLQVLAAPPLVLLLITIIKKFDLPPSFYLLL
jgi:hypothetical protein